MKLSEYKEKLKADKEYQEAYKSSSTSSSSGTRPAGAP